MRPLSPAALCRQMRPIGLGCLCLSAASRCWLLPGGPRPFSSKARRYGSFWRGRLVPHSKPSNDAHTRSARQPLCRSSRRSLLSTTPAPPYPRAGRQVSCYFPFVTEVHRPRSAVVLSVLLSALLCLFFNRFKAFLPCLFRLVNYSTGVLRLTWNDMGTWLVLGL